MVVEGRVSICLTISSPRPREEPVMRTEAIFLVYCLFSFCDKPYTRMEEIVARQRTLIYICTQKRGDIVERVSIFLGAKIHTVNYSICDTYVQYNIIY